MSASAPLRTWTAQGRPAGGHDDERSTPPRLPLAGTPLGRCRSRVRRTSARDITN